MVLFGNLIGVTGAKVKVELPVFSAFVKLSLKPSDLWCECTGGAFTS